MSHNRLLETLRSDLADEVNRAEVAHGPEVSVALKYALTDGEGNYGGSLSRGKLALLLGGDTRRVRRFALGVEILHHATLCVDDLIDFGVNRRAKDSVWRKFSREAGLLLSHYMTNRAQSLFAETLSPQSGSIGNELIEGMVAVELRTRTRTPADIADYLSIVRCKTGALYAIAALSLTIESRATVNRDLLSAFEKIGCARQIRDDLADAEKGAGVLFVDSLAHQQDMERSFGRDCKLLAHRSEFVSLQERLAQEAFDTICPAMVKRQHGDEIDILLREIALGRTPSPVPGPQSLVSSSNWDCELCASNGNVDPNSRTEARRNQSS